MYYKLDVDDMSVTVRPLGDSAWLWNVNFNDGSSGLEDSDWCPTVNGAKRCARQRYDYYKWESKLPKDTKSKWKIIKEESGEI